MFKHLFRPEPESGKSKKRIIATSLTTTVWIAINFFSLPIQAQSDYEGLGRRGTRIWGDRACNITGLASQEEITNFLDHCAPKYTPEEQAYLDMKTQAAIGLLSFFFFDIGVFQRPSPSVVRRVTDYVDEGVSTVGTYRGSNGSRTITVQRRSSQIVIKDIKTGEIRVVNSRTGQLVDDVDGTIANGNTREGESQARRNNRGNTTTEDPCLSYAPTSTSKNLIAKLYSWLSIQSAEAACDGGGSPSQRTFSRQEIESTIQSSRRIRGQTTEGARAIAKKQGHAQSDGFKSAFDGIKATQSNAEHLIENIMLSSYEVKPGAKTTDIYNTIDQGVRIENLTGKFVGFLERSLATP